MQVSSNQENCTKWFIAKQMRYNDLNLQCWPLHILHTSSSFPQTHKFLRRRSLLVAVPACHALPPLPPHAIWRYIHVERLLGARRDFCCWLPNLLNKADEVTPPVLNPKSVSQYDMLYEVGCCHAADRLVTGFEPLCSRCT